MRETNHKRENSFLFFSFHLNLHGWVTIDLVSKGKQNKKRLNLCPESTLTGERSGIVEGTQRFPGVCHLLPHDDRDDKELPLLGVLIACGCFSLRPEQQRTGALYFG